MALIDKLTAIGDAIRAKTGGMDTLTLDGMVTAIEGISAGGDTSAEDGIIMRTIDGEYNNSRVTNIGSYVFQNCSALTTAYFPAATSIGTYAFQNCWALKTANAPAVTSIGSYAFQNCYKLTAANFPSVTSIGASAFQYCYPLTTANVRAVTSIGANAFNVCSGLVALIIEQTDSVCTLSSTNAFGGCYHILGTVNSTYNPEGLKDGYIYVPDALVEDYKAATNWSTYADQIKPLSEYVEVSE